MIYHTSLNPQGTRAMISVLSTVTPRFTGKWRIDKFYFDRKPVTDPHAQSFYAQQFSEALRGEEDGIRRGLFQMLPNAMSANPAVASIPDDLEEPEFYLLSEDRFGNPFPPIDDVMQKMQASSDAVERGQPPTTDQFLADARQIMAELLRTLRRGAMSGILRVRSTSDPDVFTYAFDVVKPSH